MKVSAILSIVCGGLRGELRAPEGAFDVGEAGGVGAGVGRVDGGVAFEIDVECRALWDAVTQFLALVRVVVVEGIETQIAVSAG